MQPDRLLEETLRDRTVQAELAEFQSLGFPVVVFATVGPAVCLRAFGDRGILREVAIGSNYRAPLRSLLRKAREAA